MSKLEKLCRLAGVGGILAALVMLPILLVGTAAHATDAFYVNYFANAQVGTTDDVIRIIDTNVRAASGSGTDFGPQPLCAMVYVFDEYQEMQECCGCPVSAGGRIDLSVDGLTRLPADDFLAGGVTGVPPPSLLYRGTIKIVSTNSSITALLSGASNGPCAGQEAVICDPALDAFTATPTASMRAWTTHLQTANAGWVSETRFERTDEPDTDLSVMADTCSAIKTQPSFNPSASPIGAAGRGSCAAVCAAGGVDPYPKGYYGGGTTGQLAFDESQEGTPADLCYTGQ